MAHTLLSQSTAITRAIADHASEYFHTRNRHYKPKTPTEATRGEASHRGWVARIICPVSDVLLGRVGLVYGWSMPPPSGEQWGDEYGMPHNMYDVCPYAMVMYAMIYTCHVVCACVCMYGSPALVLNLSHTSRDCTGRDLSSVLLTIQTQVGVCRQA